MSWKARIGSIAGKLGLDADAVVAKVEQAGRTTVQAAAQLQSAATSMVDDFRASRGTKSRPSAEKAEIGAPPAKKAVLVQLEKKSVFDTSGLKLALDDAAEIVRGPKELYDAVVVARYGSGQVSTELAERICRYIATTTPSIFAVDLRARAEASAIAARSGRDYGQVNALWETFVASSLVLSQYDAVNGTDFAATAWLMMLSKWNVSDLPADRNRVDGALAAAIDLVAASPRKATHAAPLFDRLTTFRHAGGWPTSLFTSGDQLAKLWDIASSTADNPETGGATATTLGRFAQAALDAPIAQAEWGEGRMHPHVVRLEIGIGASTALTKLGSPLVAELGERAVALMSAPETRPSSDDLAELQAIPRELTSSDAPLTSKDAARLRAWVDGVPGDHEARSLRHTAYARTPLTRMMLCSQLGLKPDTVVQGVSLSDHLALANKRLAKDVD